MDVYERSPIKCNKVSTADFRGLLRTIDGIDKNSLIYIIPRVSTNVHSKSDFRQTFADLGPCKSSKVQNEITSWIFVDFCRYDVGDDELKDNDSMDS